MPFRDNVLILVPLEMHSLWFLMTYLLDEDMLFGYLYRNCGKD